MIKLPKTYDEINDKIRKGEVVVVTAEEMVGIVAEDGPAKAAERVDVVTTGTFGPMCSSGAFLNTGHGTPRMKMSNATLNGVPAYAGLAAVDLYIGATEPAQDDPLNNEFPGKFNYGGAHVIADLVAGKDVRLQATAYGTDCYPRKELDTWINLEDLNEAYMLNPRNAYQNYGVAVNLTIGSRIFLGGAQGYVYWQGTQHDPTGPRNEHGVPKGGAGTLGTVADLKDMDPRYVVGVSYLGYGVSQAIGLGTAIPVLDEQIAVETGISDADIVAPITDYSRNYPWNEGEALGFVSYADLKTGSIEINGKQVPTAPLSSYVRAKEIAEKIKGWVAAGEFLLTEPVAPLPSPENSPGFKPLNYRPVEEEAGE